jgi:hypothetical protein
MASGVALAAFDYSQFGGESSQKPSSLRFFEWSGA